MKHYSDVVLIQGANRELSPAVAAQVTVLGHVSQTLATIFADDGVTPKNNPVLTDAEGRFDFFVADGRYDLNVTGNGFTNFSLVDIEITDILEATATDNEWVTEGMQLVNQGAIPPVPPVGKVALFTQAADKNVYMEDDTGRVIQLGGGVNSMDAISQGSVYFKHPYVSNPVQIDNGNFEIPDPTNSFPGWEINGNFTPSYEIATPYEGLQSIRLDSNGVSSGSAIFNLGNTPSCRPGDVFFLSCAAKTDGILTANIGITWLPDGLNSSLSTSVAASTSSVAWTVISGFVTAPALASLAVAEIFSTPSTTVGTIWIDDVKVYKVSTAAVVSQTANPAQSGFVRLANGDAVASRDSGNTTDVSLISLDSQNFVDLGTATFTPLIPGANLTFGNSGNIGSLGPIASGNGSSITLTGSNGVGIGPHTGGNIVLSPGNGNNGGAAGAVSIAASRYFFPSSVAFASLGAPVNGALIYCTDCTTASPCAGGGTGAMAKRLNGAWVCS